MRKTKKKNIRFEEIDDKRLKALAAKMELSGSAVIRQLIKKAYEELLDKTDYAENTAYFYSDEQQAQEQALDDAIEKASIEG